jgi:hypothetical protein
MLLLKPLRYLKFSYSIVYIYVNIDINSSIVGKTTILSLYVTCLLDLFFKLRLVLSLFDMFLFRKTSIDILVHYHIFVLLPDGQAALKRMRVKKPENMIDIKDLKPCMMEILPSVGMEISPNIVGNTKIIDRALFNWSHSLYSKCYYKTKQDADQLSHNNICGELFCCVLND